MSDAGRSGVYIEDAIDSLPLRGMMLRVPLLCSVLMVVEGIDTYGISFVAPFLGKELDVSPERMGVIFTATVVASLLGAVGLAPLSDRIGRRKVLLICSLLVGLATLLTPLASNFYALIALRFVIGVGFGAALPTSVALVADYAPKRRRSMLVMAMSSSIVVGMVVVGVSAAMIIPAHGWRALLYACGALSLVVTLVLWAYLPESFRFLMSTDPRGPGTKRLLERLLGDAAVAQPVTMRDTPSRGGGGVGPQVLLEPSLVLKTGLLWFLMSASYGVVNFAGYWIPTILLNEGYELRHAALVGPGGQTFAVAVMIFVSWLMDRVDMAKVLSACYACSAVAFIAVASAAGQPMISMVLLALGLSLLGAGLSGGLALTSSAYAAQIRATAVGWILGMARFIGGGAGTLAGGFLVGAGWTSGGIAVLMGSTVAAGTGALLIMMWRGTTRTDAAVRRPAV